MTTAKAEAMWVPSPTIRGQIAHTRLGADAVTGTPPSGVLVQAWIVGR